MKGTKILCPYKYQVPITHFIKIIDSCVMPILYVLFKKETHTHLACR